MTHRYSSLGRRSQRLPDFDYSSYGAYFITLVTHERHCSFGEVRGEDVCLSALGKLVESEWLRTPAIRPTVELDEFVIMPNHFHAVVWLLSDESSREGAHAPARTFGHTTPRSLSTLVNGFKGAVTRGVVNLNGDRNVWQRGYYERIIRNEKELSNIRQYIRDNPRLWAEDEENPSRIVV